MTTHFSDENSLEEKKINVEIAKLELEQKKYDLLKSSYYVDLIAKVAIPFALAGIAWATYITNSTHASDTMAFEANVKRVELRQKEEELFLKKSDFERNRDALKSTFIQNNLALITSQSPESEQQLRVLVKAAFSAQDAEDLLFKVMQIRISTPKSYSPSKIESPSTPSAYKAIGRNYIAAGNFEQALLNFETATLLNASDVEAWNSKAYAEMRTNRNDAALKSISTTINLHPTDSKLQHFVMLNATKILCSLGRNDDALSYLKQGIAFSPNLLDIAKSDQELLQRCGFRFS